MYRVFYFKIIDYCIKERILEEDACSFRDEVTSGKKTSLLRKRARRRVDTNLTTKGV
jgi:hypothetical protein